jgi:hypothetical protein
MSSVRHQTLFSAPVDVVWELVGDPGSYPEWAADVVDVTGLPTRVEKGSTFQQESRTPIGKSNTTFVVDALEDMREIKLRCLTSGYYSHWALTEAQGECFVDVEFGMEPTNLPFKAVDKTVGKRLYRNTMLESIDSLRETIARRVEKLGAGDEPAARG